MKFTPQLNVKTFYNFQNSLIKTDEYIDFASINKFEYLFYFENETMHGVAEFTKKCLKKNIKPIIGLNIELSKNNFVSILCLNKKGYENINYISYYLNDNKKISDIEKLELVKDSVDENNLIIYKLDLFENVKFNTLPENEYDVNIKKIFYNNIRYFSRKEIKYFVGLYALKNNLKYEKAKEIYKIDESYPECEEISNIYPENDILLNEIANKTFVNIFLDKQTHFGKYKSPNNVSTFQYLKQVCFNSLKIYFEKNLKAKNNQSDYLNRLNYELETIEKTGFSDYFLIVYDYVNFAKKNEIIVGPGRGSAAGSLVSFLLRITNVDPIQYELFFERFLNPERITMPDIDIDFQDNKRDEVIEYIFDNYGKYFMSTIVTYQTVGFKSAFRDACRVYDVSLDFVNSVSKMIINDQLSYFEIIKSNEIVSSYANSFEYSHIFELTEKFMGLLRQTGTHAAGIVISDKDLRYLIPIKQSSTGIYQTQYDMNYLEDLGLIKMDILGLRNLTTLKEIINSIYKNYKLKINLNNLDLDDQSVYDLLNRGETTGIFQLESSGMTDLVKKINVKNIEDIATASALYRPGPMSMIPTYLHNKKTKNFDYFNEELKDVLSPTYGIIIYQEQVMKILQKVANFSLGKADIIRRAISKKQANEIRNFEKDFISSATSKGTDKKQAEIIWGFIEKFASYGFNKSHAVAYSLISYWLAWFKKYYPAEFYASLLNTSANNSTKTKLYLEELKKYGVEIFKPSVKFLNKKFIGIGKKLYMPLTIMKGVGENFVENLRDLIKNGAEIYSDLTSFFFYIKDNGLNEKNYESMAKGGAFDCFGKNNITMFENRKFIFSAIASFDKSKPLVEQNSIDNLFNFDLNEDVQANYEKEVFGFYINENPLAKAKNENAFFKPQNIGDLNEKMQNVNIIGQILSIKKSRDKNNNEMAFINFFDETGTIDITIFASTLNELKNELILNKKYIFEIRVQKYKEKITAVLNKIVKPLK